MSTADSCLNSSSILFSNDIAPFLKLFATNQLTVARLFTLITGGLGLWIVICKGNNLYDLMIFASSLYRPIVSIPFLMAILGFRPRFLSVLLGMGAGAVTVVAFNFFELGIYLGMTNRVAPAMLMNLVFLIGKLLSTS